MLGNFSCHSCSKVVGASIRWGTRRESIVYRKDDAHLVILSLKRTIASSMLLESFCLTKRPLPSLLNISMLLISISKGHILQSSCPDLFTCVSSHDWTVARVPLYSLSLPSDIIPQLQYPSLYVFFRIFSQQNESSRTRVWPESSPFVRHHHQRFCGSWRYHQLQHHGRRFQTQSAFGPSSDSSVVSVTSQFCLVIPSWK